MPFRLVGYNKNIDTSSPEATRQSILDLVQWTTYEFQGVAQAMLSTEADKIWNVVPPKPRTGTQAYADGTHWNPGAGEGFYEYTSGGIWVPMFASAAVRTVKFQRFTASGTYTPSPGMIYCVLESVGGGGGGGGIAGSASSQFGACGGSSGGYSRATVTAAAIGASKAVTVGPGGAGGLAGANAGVTGGATSIGTLCVANGGGGAPGASTSVSPLPGAVAAAGTGDIAAQGSPGTNGMYANATGLSVEAIGGNGGASFFGGGGSGGVSGGTAVAGSNGSAFGSGGGGAASNIAGNAAGGSGAIGLAWVTEFCSQ